MIENLNKNNTLSKLASTLLVTIISSSRLSQTSAYNFIVRLSSFIAVGKNDHFVLDDDKKDSAKQGFSMKLGLNLLCRLELNQSYYYISIRMEI